MNVVKHFIKEIISKEYVYDEDKNFKYIKVAYLIDCYGNIKKETEIYFNEQEIEKDMKNGYFFSRGG